MAPPPAENDLLSAPAWSLAGGEFVPTGGSGPPLPEPERDRYVLLNEVGRGGMGQVWVAHDRVLGREVALKVLNAELSAREDAEARLRREAQLTAVLDHPGVVAVHDVGRTPEGRLFYTMRLVRGRSLEAAIAAARHPAERRELVRPLLQACEAVAYAHAAGVLHRDLKPGNILLGDFGETQVVDWGLAVRVEDSHTAGVGGTPAFMSPEQAQGLPVDARADVYALGATLRAVLGEELQALPELRAIADRATAAAPEQRYPNAGALAGDLLAWFEGRQVGAYSYTPLELLRRLLRAWRVPLLMGALALLATSAALGLGYRRTATQRDRAIAAEARLAGSLGQAEELLGRVLAEQAATALMADRRAEAETRAIASLQRLENPEARGVLAAFGRTPRPRLLASRPGPECLRSAISPTADLLVCATATGTTAWRLPDLTQIWTVAMQAVDVWVGPERVLVRTAATEVAGLSRESGALLHTSELIPPIWRLRPRILTLQTHAELARTPPERWEGYQPCPRGTTGILVLHPTLDRVASVCTDGLLSVGLGPEALRVRTPLTGNEELSSLVWSPDGTRLVGGTLRGGLSLLDAQTGEVLRSIRTSLGTIDRVLFSPDGRLAVVSGSQGGVGLWALPSGSWLGELPASAPRSLAFAPDGQTLWVYDGQVSQWALDSQGSPYRIWAQHGLADLRPSPDGQLLALTHPKGLTLVDLRRGAEARTLPMGEGVTKSVGFGPDGGWVVASNVQGEELVAWTLPDLVRLPLEPYRAFARRLVVRPGGDLLGALNSTAVVWWSDPTQPPIQRREVLDRLLVDMEGAGGWVIAVDDLGAVHRMAPDTVELVAWLRRPGAILAAVSADGQRAAVAAENRLWWLDGQGRTLVTLELPGANLRDLAVAPDGSSFAAGGLDGITRVWDAGGQLLALLAGHSERVSAIEYSQDGRWLFTASWDHSARILDLGVLRRPVSELAAEVHAAWGKAQAGLSRAPTLE